MSDADVLTPCTKEEALAAVRASAFTVEHEPVYEAVGVGSDAIGLGRAVKPDDILYVNVTPPPERIIHSMAGGGGLFLGCDSNLEGVEAEINGADEVGWVDHIAGHDLAVKFQGKWCCYDVKRPRT